MKIFVDTANLDDIKRAYSWGIVDGVTTNPTLIAKEGCDFKTRILEICDVVDGPVSAEVVSLDYEGMVRDAREISSWHKNIVIKLPMTKESMQAVRTISPEGIRTNITLMFSATQAFLAAKAGGTYLSLFVGRLDDAGHNGMEAVYDTVNMINTYGFDSEVIVASVRHQGHIIESLRAGAHVATIPFKVIDQMFQHPLTDSGIEKFLDDWKKVPNK
ncbi:MAG: fructose-6-phosphate aldolase [Armatimonadota bacterium]